MSSLPYEYFDSQQSFKFQTFNQSDLRQLEEFFRAYQKLSPIMSLKFPINQHFRIAQINQIILYPNQLLVSYFYEGNNNHKYPVIYGQQQFKRALPLPKDIQEKQRLDVVAIKSVFQALIEMFHWSANFGLFFDPNYENLLYKECEGDFYLFIPSFMHIAQQINKQNEYKIRLFDEFRIKIYQNLTFIFFLRFIKEFFDLIKQQDEDINLYKKIKDKYNYSEDIDKIDPYQIAETCQGVDFIYSEDLVKKKMIRYGLKQSQFLYQINKNEILKATLYKYHENEQNFLNQNMKPDDFKDITLTSNVINFFKQFKTKPIQGTSYDIKTPFIKTLFKEKDNTQILIRRNWKQINTKHELDLIDQNKQQDQSLQNKQQISQNQDQVTSQMFDVKWSSWINPQNLIYMSISQSGALVDKDLKKFTITYKIEMLEDKNCYLVKTQVPEILFGLDTADDIAYFVNSIQKEKMPTNVYVDDTRKLTFYTALVSGNPGPILWDILKIMDIHQIYFYISLDFYNKNIFLGKQIKEVKYSSFLTELKNILKDYEYDSKLIYANFLNQKLGEEGF
ncbi:unnamed protein product [Paramecium sonneborni]|uniref:Uncharacterized protein n=1 Tax=Paramecium sonneborni TaxID=65129 RepID=A0A8S1NXU8_9CILI|nr:unnamed protein product [Paramecium sonneborni]